MATSERARNNLLTPPLRTLSLVLLVVAVFYLAREVLLPFALAVLLSFLLSPLATRLQRWGLGRIGGVVVTVVLAFAVIAGLGWVVVKNAMDVASQLPRYEETLVSKVRALRSTGDGSLTKAAATVERIEQEIVGPDEESAEAASTPGKFTLRKALFGEEPLPVQIVDTSLAPVRMMSELEPLMTALGGAAIVVVFVIFILLERENLRDRIIRLAGTNRVYVTTQALEDAAQRVSRYLLMQLIVNSVYGAAVGAGLYFIGLPNAILWGLMATLLRFLPYVGPIIAATTPIVLSMAVFEGWQLPLATMALFLVAELITNNVLEPWLYGTSTGVSTLAIVTAAVFWTWLWGPVGLVLATPLTVCLTVMARHIPQLAFLNVLLADAPPLETKYRFYQRLLAQDYEDASDVAREFLHNGSLEELYETMFVPALTLAERDRDAGRLHAAQESFVYESISELTEEMRDEFAVSAANSGPAEPAVGEEPHSAEEVEPTHRRILCLAAEDEADHIAAAMFAQLLSARGYLAETADMIGASEEMLRRLETDAVEGVVLSAIAPNAAVRMRAICRKMRRRDSHVKVLVGLWSAPSRLERMQTSLKKAGADVVTSSFREGLEYFHETLPIYPIAAPPEELEEAVSTETPEVRPA